MTVVTVMERDGNVRSVHGPFENEESAREFMERAFPRHVTQMHEVEKPF